LQDGRKPGDTLSLDEELARLTQSTYPPAQLLQRPLPDGVDPTKLEEYLAPEHFEVIIFEIVHKTGLILNYSV
jgi:supervillin